MHIQSFTFNPIQENTYILYDETKECVIVDPGCYDREEKDEIYQWIYANNLKVKYLLNTHCHVDHVAGNQFIKTTFQVPLLIHPKETEILRSAKLYCALYGFVAFEESDPDQFIDENSSVKFGNTTLDVLFLPGHSPGHIAFIDRKDKICISGDVLFFRSIGRTDLPGGHHQTLINSIKNTLFNLEDEYKVYSGHGSPTLLGDEKQYNPYVGKS